MTSWNEGKKWVPELQFALLVHNRLESSDSLNEFSCLDFSTLLYLDPTVPIMDLHVGVLKPNQLCQVLEMILIGAAFDKKRLVEVPIIEIWNLFKFCPAEDWFPFLFIFKALARLIHLKQHLTFASPTIVRHEHLRNVHKVYFNLVWGHRLPTTQKELQILSLFEVVVQISSPIENGTVRLIFEI